MFCGKCGNQIPDNSAFCPHCGAQLGGSFASQQTSAGGNSYGSEFGAGFAGGSSNPNCTNGFKGVLGFWVDMWKKNYINAKTRATRKEYWSIILINAIISSILGLIWTPLASLFSLAIIIPNICVLIRRCHDIGKKGSIIILVYVIEIVGAILAAVGVYLRVAYSVAAWYGYYSGYYTCGLILAIIGFVLAIAAAVIILIIGFKGSVREDNQWGPYPFK